MLVFVCGGSDQLHWGNKFGKTGLFFLSRPHLPPAAHLPRPYILYTPRTTWLSILYTPRITWLSVDFSLHDPTYVTTYPLTSSLFCTAMHSKKGEDSKKQLKMWILSTILFVQFDSCNQPLSTCAMHTSWLWFLCFKHLNIVDFWL